MAHEPQSQRWLRTFTKRRPGLRSAKSNGRCTQDISSTTIASLVEVLKFFKTSGEASRWGAPDTLDGHLKHLMFERPASIVPGVLQLLAVGSSLVCSEAIAETYGSVMEDYQRGRLFINDVYY